jgi:hypothetical protein
MARKHKQASLQLSIVCSGPLENQGFALINKSENFTRSRCIKETRRREEEAERHTGERHQDEPSSLNEEEQCVCKEDVSKKTKVETQRRDKLSVIG